MLSAPATTFEFTAGTNAFVAASAVGGRLIAGIQGVLWSVPRTGGQATALTSADLEPTRVAWSPDGSRIAVCAYQGGGFHVWTMAPDGSRQRQLTSGPWDDRGVAWSPDGSRIAFASERGGDPVAGSSYSIWTVDVRSGELAQLTDDPDVEDYDPAWHPDGTRLVFVRAGTKGGRTLASVPAGAGRSRWNGQWTRGGPAGRERRDILTVGHGLAVHHEDGTRRVEGLDGIAHLDVGHPAVRGDRRTNQREPVVGL